MFFYLILEFIDVMHQGLVALGIEKGSVGEDESFHLFDHSVLIACSGLSDF
jgi:hypothetical protein